MLNTRELPLYLRFYKLIKYLYLIKRQMKREYKYEIGQDIMRLAWRGLDLVMEVNSLPNEKKRVKIEELSLVFDKLKLRLRLAAEIGLMSKGQFSHLSENYLCEIGRMIGGWMKWA